MDRFLPFHGPINPSPPGKLNFDVFAFPLLHQTRVQHRGCKVLLCLGVVVLEAANPFAPVGCSRCCGILVDAAPQSPYSGCRSLSSVSLILCSSQTRTSSGVDTTRWYKCTGAFELGNLLTPIGCHGDVLVLDSKWTLLIKYTASVHVAVSSGRRSLGGEAEDGNCDGSTPRGGSNGYDLP